MSRTATEHRVYGDAAGAVWAVLLVLGIAVTALGAVLVANPSDSASTLAILVGLALVLAGITEVLAAGRAPEPARAAVFGVLLVLGGIVALAWPDVTLWTLAVIVGVSLVIAGFIRLIIASAAPADDPGRGRAVAAGILCVIAGIVAMSWPSATVFVLAVVFGIWLIVHGVTQIILALSLRRALAATAP